MATVETVYSKAVESRLASAITQVRQEKSPFIGRFKQTSRGVVPLNVGSSGYQFERIVNYGMGGVTRFVGVTGPQTISGIAPLQMLNEVQLYPAATEATIPGQDKMIGYLSQMRGNLINDEAMMRLENLPNNTGEIFDNMMESCGLRIYLQDAAAWYTPSSTTRHICSIGTIVAQSNTSIEFVPAEGNEVLFHEGHLVQIWGQNTSTGAIWSRHAVGGLDAPNAVALVRAVDPMTRSVTLVSLDGITNLFQVASNTVVATDLIAHHGQLSTNNTGVVTTGGTPVAVGPYGMVDFIINTGTLLSIDTAVFRRVRSLINTNLGGPLTEIEMEKHLHWYRRWHDKKIMNFFMTGGVMLAYKDTMLGMFRADRTGTPAVQKIVGGGYHTGMEHVHDGITVRYWQDNYMRAGFAIGVYMDEGNFEEMVPPTTGERTGSNKMVGNVEFLYNRDGSVFRDVGWAPPGGGMVMPTTIREAPFRRWHQRWPKHLPAIMIGGITESNYTPGT